MVMQEYQESLKDFCTYYKGPKLCINTRNVGFSLSQMVHTPGGNRILHSLHIHNDEEAFNKEVENLQTIEHDKVCKEVAEMLCIKSTMRYTDDDYIHIGLTGKLSTGIWDRDDSEAYISIDSRLYKLKLNKLEIDDYIIVQREKRIPLLEDYAISQSILSIISKGLETMPELGTGFLKKINLMED